MRKEILDALKAKFTGVSDAILGRIADKLAKTATTAEQVATAVEGVTFQQVLESYGDSRATEAQQTAVSNYEKKHGLKDGKQVKGGASAEHNDEPDNQHGNGDNDTPAWAKAIIDGQKSLSDRLAAIEGDKVTASRKQKFDAIIGKLPEDLRKPYARTDIKSISDEEFDTLLSEVGTEVEELAKTANARGAVSADRPQAAQQKPQRTASKRRRTRRRSVSWTG